MGISVYPNPGSAEVMVSMSTAADKGWHVYLTDLTGRTIAEQEIMAGDTDAKISTAALTPGCYMVLVSHNGQIVAAEKWLKN